MEIVSKALYLGIRGAVRKNKGVKVTGDAVASAGKSASRMKETAAVAEQIFNFLCRLSLGWVESHFLFASLTDCDFKIRSSFLLNFTWYLMKSNSSSGNNQLIM